MRERGLKRERIGQSLLRKLGIFSKFGVTIFKLNLMPFKLMDRMQTILKLYYQDLFRKDYDENIENKNK